MVIKSKIIWWTELGFGREKNEEFTNICIFNSLESDLSKAIIVI